MSTETMRQSFFRLLLLAFLVSVFSAGCVKTLVAPYDENLVASTEAFYVKAAGIVEEGRSVSPRTDQERAAITNPAAHKGHFSKFEARYSDLIVDAEALILRAMASSDQIDIAGQKLQQKLDELIESNIPSVCAGLSDAFGQTSLTAGNYIDLKCIVTRWKAQHADPSLTRDTLILKKANWDGRKNLIFNAILAIQKAEAFKNSNQEP
ncbi:hypothetical protein DSCA_42390 [Desulfosarcina alkanivorans]|jgi:hypothetical protein|uniref:Lipoprotein n=1 Tax=Desulfosarcina alkanivorans TaxID=571177 RepID=A0A5K7YQY2_9BACT|nr:hypothetical protein [Desulfosarcina alkanivorans]BBO70309.1 hypothetical protein DSCA_42390 [Desulfosarcina alkanivorans]